MIFSANKVPSTTVFFGCCHSCFHMQDLDVKHNVIAVLSVECMYSTIIWDKEYFS